MKHILLASSLLLLSNMALAAGKVTSTVENVRVDRSGKGIIDFSTPLETPADCRNVAYSSHLSFDTSTPGGKAIYSMALAAASSGKKITAYGTGSCLDYANTVESMSYGHYHK